MTMVYRPSLTTEHRRGFSLIEMLIVIVIIGIGSALSIKGMVSIRSSFTLDQAAQELQSQLRRAQSEAIRQNRRITVTMVNDSTYRLSVTASGTLIVEEQLPWPVKFVTPSAASVIVQSFGHPLTSAQFVVANYRSKRTVAVSALGRVTVSTTVPL
jgi:prepilin-type N-terminal cleavage/methylation domain-containing protein